MRTDLIHAVNRDQSRPRFLHWRPTFRKYSKRINGDLNEDLLPLRCFCLAGGESEGISITAAAPGPSRVTCVRMLALLEITRSVFVPLEAGQVVIRRMKWGHVWWAARMHLGLWRWEIKWKQAEGIPSESWHSRRNQDDHGIIYTSSTNPFPTSLLKSLSVIMLRGHYCGTITG